MRLLKTLVFGLTTVWQVTGCSAGINAQSDSRHATPGVPAAAAPRSALPGSSGTAPVEERFALVAADLGELPTCAKDSNAGRMAYVDGSNGARRGLYGCLESAGAFSWKIVDVSEPQAQGTGAADGQKGEKGDSGAKGDQGVAGPQGVKGDQGVAGPQGVKGDQGVAGAQGAKGDQGVAGPQGAKGDQGVAGPQGVAGSSGSSGSSGSNGKTWLGGAGTPSAAAGSDGDYYLDTTSGNVYKKVSGAWGSALLNLVGPQGTQGAQGAQGPQGPAGGAGGVDPATFRARLSLSSTQAVTTTDQAAKTSVYLVAFGGTSLSLFNGTAWITDSLTSSVGVAVPNTTNTNFDVFVHDVSGTPVLETVDWTDDTTRATALTLHDGVYVSAADATRRYAGTGRTTGVAGESEDSVAKRFLWNRANQVPRALRRNGASARYQPNAGYTWRPRENNAAGSRFEFVVGLSEVPAQVTLQVSVWNSGSGTACDTYFGIGINSTNSLDASSSEGWGMYRGDTASATWRDTPRAGYSYVQWLEMSAVSSNCQLLEDPFSRMTGVIGG